MIRVGMRVAFEGGYGRKVAIGIGAYAQTHDWVIELLDPDPSSAFSSAAAAVGRFDGLIVQANTRAWARDAARQGIPVVNVGTVWPGLALSRVGVDNVEVGELAARHLRDLGLGHFAFVGQSPFSFSRERLTGFRRELRRTGHRCRVCPARISSNETQLAEWLARLRRPVGICASSDSWGYRTLCACRLAGLRVPEEVAVIGADNDELLCHWSSPPLSSIPVPAERIGQTAAAMLDGLATGRSATPEVLLRPGPPVVRQSTDNYYVKDPDVLQALHFMRERLDRGTCVKNLLTVPPLGRRRIEQKFRASLGTSPGRVLKSMRLQRIKRLLVETDLSMKEIAARAGYATAQHMANMFRMSENRSPLAFRRQSSQP